MKVRRLRRLLDVLSARHRSRRATACRRPTIEFLEARELLSTTFTVTNAGDNGNNAAPLSGSLRAAIVQADALAPGTASTIKFAIPGGAFQTINLQAPLPQITTPATIDGTTQTGYTGTPLIELNGSSAGAGAVGLSYASTASGTASVLTQVKALQIFSFKGAGVMDSGASYLSLANDDVGVQRLATYYLAGGNAGGGVVISGGADDTITSSVISANIGNGITITGGAAAYDTISADDIGTDATGVTIVDHAGKTLANTGNGVLISAGANHNSVTTSVLSNNQGDGVELTGSGTSSNVVSGDHIGTDVFGMIALPNLYNGVEVTGGASANTVGGTTASARDVISGNVDSGVSINTGAMTTVVEGDFIGTDGTGTVAIPNHTGVLVGASPSDTIGGATAGSSDVISGNTIVGVWVTSGSSKVIIAGDDIGTDLTGSQGVPNGTGVQIDASSTSNTVGGASAAARDVISGNTGAGVSISDSGTNNNLVAGDVIGTNAAGTTALGNGTAGVLIANFAHGNTVGGTAAEARDVISGNLVLGVELTNGVTTTTIAGNYVGTDVTGLLGIPNGAGVNIGGGSTSNTVGGTVAGSLNVISANVHKAVQITDAGSDDNVVQGNYLGTDATGTHALGNGGAGVSLANGAQYNTVGGTTAAARNVMAASAGNGVIIGGLGTNGATTSDNLIEGNYIGTDKTGTVALGEGIAGVNIEPGGTNNTIGGTSAAARNIISGSAFGVYIGGMGASNNLVEGNFIGTDVTGTKALGNGSGGVFLISGASGNTVGGTSAAARNIISGNVGNGVFIDSSGTTDNLVEGNYIGTDYTGEHALGNGIATGGANGVVITGGASDNTIGGTTAGAGNIVSATIGGSGVFIVGPGSNDNVVAGDFIGTDASGTHALGNTVYGILIAAASSSNTIGGTTTAASNVISGNVDSGVYISDPGTNDNVLEGDYIGTDVTGTKALGNGSGGVSIGGIIIVDGAVGNTVGGTTTGSRDLISGNAGAGVTIYGAGTTDTVVSGDYIGTDVTGTHALGNTTMGVNILEGASGNTIGGTSAGAGDVISGNLGDGVDISNAGTENDVVEGDYIGTDDTGAHALGNDGAGVSIFDGASKNTVGGTSAAARDVISGNGFDGVVIIDVGTENNVVDGDYIGTDATGAHALGNSVCGVGIALGASDNTVGGTTTAARNVISGNVGPGVYLSDPGTNDNVLEGDYVGTDVTGTKALGNGSGGIVIVNGAASNTIGGTTTGSRDLVSGNAGAGVTLYGAGTTDTVVSGDYIGTDVTGTHALGNTTMGVNILEGASGNTVGGTAAGAGDVISGNLADGVDISNAGTENNVVEGDDIGIDATGAHALGNDSCGVSIFDGALRNTVGGTTAAARDVISANGFDGVVFVNVGTENNVVEGDYIGTDATGAHALGNSNCGVGIALGAWGNTVGGTSTAARDVISGNAFGVYISDPGTDDNLVEGDDIGTNGSGTAAIANLGVGVYLRNGASGNTIGGTTAAACDVISGNADAGVYVSDSGTDDNVVEGDYIGTNEAGTAAIANGGDGIDLVNGASDNTVGGKTAAACDVISGNSGNGVVIGGSGTTGNVVTGDDIGTAANGTGGLGNGGDGVFLDGVTGNSITNSLICYNGSYGIEGIGSNTTNNTITGDTFTVTIGKTTYGNKRGAMYFH